MTTSNSSDLVSTATTDVAASASETAVTAPAPDISAQQETKGPSIEGLKEAAKKAAAGMESLPDPNAGIKGATKPEIATPVIPPAAYQANFKYKAFGKEKEIPEFWRGLIKDADSEKKVRDIFTQADAFEDMKSKHENTSKQFQEVLSEHTALDRDVRKVMSFRNNKDYDNFFSSLRIPEQEVFDWVQRKIEVMQGTPEQRQMAEMQMRERQKAYDLQHENEFLQSQYQTQAVQARTMQLDNILSRPDISKAASFFDEKSGRVGAFRDLVIEEAQKVFYSSNQDLSAEEATAQVMQRFGKFFEGSQAPQEMPQAQTAAVPQVQSKPVIPVAQGRGTSPVKKAPKSLDDLKAMYKEMQSTGA